MTEGNWEENKDIGDYLKKIMIEFFKPFNTYTAEEENEDEFDKSVETMYGTINYYSPEEIFRTEIVLNIELNKIEGGDDNE